MKLIILSWVARISASEIKNASVDSAPWFPFKRSTCKPSLHAPVSVEQSSKPRSLRPVNQRKAHWACSYHQGSDVA